MIGDWIHNKAELSKLFCEAKPFEHVLIHNFLNEAFAEQLYHNFPNPTDTNDYNWNYYNNPIEKKYSLNKFLDRKLDVYKHVFDVLQTNELIQHIKDITSIEDLENDPHLHGAGLHLYPNNGKLDMHLDYSIHPISGKERRINLIYYLNKSWKSEWGGELELRDTSLGENNLVKISPSFNTALIFRTCDDSFHGIPKPIKCPENEYRKSLAIYYVSTPRENVEKRFKAKFFPLPNQPVTPELQKLYDIRCTRLITKDDLFDDWENKGGGFW
jgi:Rps23 Pro-64 3,4-dihydroxylase Tpa1-like proline 4-hydroxylase